MKLSLLAFSALASVAMAAAPGTTVNTIQPPANGGSTEGTTTAPGATTTAPHGTTTAPGQTTGAPGGTTTAPGAATATPSANSGSVASSGAGGGAVGLPPCNYGQIKGKLLANESALLTKCQDATGFDISMINNFITKNTSKGISENRACADSYNAIFTRGQAEVECGVNVGGKTENLRKMMGLFLSGKTGNITIDGNSSSKSSSASSDLDKSNAFSTAGSTSLDTTSKAPSKDKDTTSKKDTKKSSSSKSSGATTLTATFAAAAVAVVAQLML